MSDILRKYIRMKDLTNSFARNNAVNIQLFFFFKKSMDEFMQYIMYNEEIYKANVGRFASKYDTERFTIIWSKNRK